MPQCGDLAQVDAAIAAYGASSAEVRRSGWLVAAATAAIKFGSAGGLAEPARGGTVEELEVFYILQAQL